MTPPGRGSAAFVRDLARQYPAALLRATALILLSSAAEALAVVTLVPLLGEIIQSVRPGGARGAVSELVRSTMEMLGVTYHVGTLLALVTAAMLAKGVFQWLAWRQAGATVAQVATDFRQQLIEHLFRADWSFFAGEKIGALANTLGHETLGASRAYLGACKFLAAGSLVVVYAVAVSALSLQALLFVLAMTALLVLPLRGLLRVTSRVAHDELDTQKSFVANLARAIQGIKPIRAMGAEAGYQAIARRQAHELRSAIAKQTSTAYLMRVMQEPTLVLCIAAALFVGRTLLDLDFSALALIGFAMWRIGFHVNVAQAAYRKMLLDAPTYWSLQDVIAASRAARERHAGALAPPAGPVSITLDGVSAAYGGAPVLNKISLEMPAGKVTVLVGESGAGKSTLIDLLLGLKSPSGGSIRVGGVPLADVSMQAWRRGLGYVPQGTTLLHASVLDNVRMGDNSIDEAAVLEALEAANAGAFVAALADGLHTVVGELGARLSGGQCQRIAIARALVRRPSVLILDEFSASLDPTAQAQAAALLARYKDQATIVVATHQPAILAVADVVYRIADGAVVRQR